MRDKLPVTFFVLILLASCAAPTPPPTAEIASPTPAWTPTPDAGIYPFPSLESNIIPSSAPGTETIEDPTIPTTLDELNLTESGGSDEQTAEYLREILAYDSDGDGTNDRNGYDDRYGVIIANLWVTGQLGEGIETYEQAVEAAKDMFSDVATVNGERWSVQPRNIATGEIGIAYDPETGLPYPSGMSLSGDWTSFETKFYPSPAGGDEQIVAGDNDEESFTIVVKDKETGKPRWVLVNGKWREDPKWGADVDSVAEIASVLTALDLDEKDHESFDPKYYTIETREWQGQQVQMLIHDNPEVEGTRIDAMEVEINGELRWIRGLWYATSEYPGSGGIVLDMPVSPGTDLATYFAEENGPDSVYGQFLKAIAHQRGISESQVWDYIQEHDYKIQIRFPQRANGSSYSPSLLTESDLIEIDLSQPFYRSNRAEVNLGQAVNGVVLTDLPECALFLLGDSRERSAWFVDAQGALNLIRFDYEGSMITGRAEHTSSDLFDQFEILAAMTDEFSDVADFGPSQWLAKYFARTGANYRPGNTVLDLYTFLKYNADFTDVDWSLLVRR